MCTAPDEDFAELFRLFPHKCVPLYIAWKLAAIWMAKPHEVTDESNSSVGKETERKAESS